MSRGLSRRRVYRNLRRYHHLLRGIKRHRLLMLYSSSDSSVGSSSSDSSSLSIIVDETIAAMEHDFYQKTVQSTVAQKKNSVPDTIIVAKHQESMSDSNMGSENRPKKSHKKTNQDHADLAAWSYQHHMSAIREYQKDALDELRRHNRSMEELEKRKNRWDIKLKELDYKTSLWTTYKSLRDSGMPKQKIKNIFPEMKAYMSEDEE